MEYILENIPKVKSITIKKDDDFEGAVQIGFSAEPACEEEDSNVGEVGLYLGFSHVEGEEHFVKLIKHVLSLGVRVSDEGLQCLL